MYPVAVTIGLEVPPENVPIVQPIEVTEIKSFYIKHSITQVLSRGEV